MVKAKLGFFQVQIERMLRYTVKLRQASFRIAPKGLNAIDMPIAIRKFILAMVYPKVFVKNQYQPSHHIHANHRSESRCQVRHAL